MHEAGKVHARGTTPDHDYRAQVKDRKDGKRAALSEARKILCRACRILTEPGGDALTVASTRGLRSPRAAHRDAARPGPASLSRTHQMGHNRGHPASPLPAAARPC